MNSLGKKGFQMEIYDVLPNKLRFRRSPFSNRETFSFVQNALPYTVCCSLDSAHFIMVDDTEGSWNNDFTSLYRWFYKINSFFKIVLQTFFQFISIA